MSRNYKNIIKLRKNAFGEERRKNLNKEIVKDSTPIPLPLEYEDIDREFKKWVDESLRIVFENRELPTFSLFSNQRFSEFMQSWDEVDEKKNLIVNFKTVTRENNPKGGTLLGNTKNIPGDYSILMKRVEAYDKANRKYYIDYRVKQPFTVDLIYTVGIITNKYELLNEFNQKVNEQFKSINCYIRPNGHLIPMKLNDISDESEYNIDNRTYYSQNYSITVMAYIMPKESFIVEEIPNMIFAGFEGEKRKGSYAEIEELPCWMEKEDENKKDYDYIPINIRIHFDTCNFSGYKFKIDTNFQTKNIKLTNVRSFKITVNDVEVELNEDFSIKEHDEIKISKLIRYNSYEDAEILIEGFNLSEIYNTKDEIYEKEIIID